MKKCTNYNRKYFVYVLKHPNTLLPFYVGCTTNPKLRKERHNSLWKKKMSIIPIFEILEMVRGTKRGEDAEYKWISEMKNTHGDLITNKKLKRGSKYKKIGRRRRASEKQKPIKKKNKLVYVPMKWHYLSDKELETLSKYTVSWGEYSKIADLCAYSDERIRQLFTRKERKVHPRIYAVLNKLIFNPKKIV